jgi:hypothetical protein
MPFSSWLQKEEKLGNGPAEAGERMAQTQGDHIPQPLQQLSPALQASHHGCEVIVAACRAPLGPRAR